MFPTGFYQPAMSKFGQECACFQKTNDMQLSLVLDIQIRTKEGQTYMQRNYTSKSFTKFLMKGRTISSNLIANDFNERRVIRDLRKSIEEVIKIVNSGSIPDSDETLPKSGFSVLGWIRMGESKDHADENLPSYKSSSNNIDSSKVLPHFTCITPTGFDVNDAFDAKLDQYRYDPTKLLNSLNQNELES